MRIIMAAIALFAGVLVITASESPLVGRAASATGIDAQVVVEKDAREVPLSGAAVEVSSLALRTTTDASGNAQLNNIAVANDVAAPTTIDVKITALGYGSFTYLHVPLYPTSRPILTPVLTAADQVDDLSAPPPRQVPSNQLGQAPQAPLSPG